MAIINIVIRFKAPQRYINGTGSARRLRVEQGWCKLSVRNEHDLRLLLAARFWRLFCFSGRIARRLKNRDKNEARSDQQASINTGSGWMWL